VVGISTAVAFAAIDLLPALGAAEVDDMRKLLVDPMKDSPSQVEKPTFFLWLKAELEEAAGFVEAPTVAVEDRAAEATCCSDMMVAAAIFDDCGGNRRKY
jgi:hypothetical protein